MKFILFLLTFLFINNAHSNFYIDKGFYFLKDKSYTVDGIISISTDGSINLIQDKNTSSEFNIKLEGGKETKKNYHNNKVELCIRFKESCLFKCKAQLVKILKFYPGDKKLRYSNINKFNSVSCK